MPSIVQPRYPLWMISFIFVFLIFYLFAGGRSKEGFTEPSSWTYDPLQHADHYGLTEKQCSIAFPKLFKPIIESVERLERAIEQKDTVGDVHWGECRAMLYDNRVYVLDDWPDNIANDRKFGTLHAINRAVNAMAVTGYKFPNIEFSLAYQDQNADRSRPNWAYDRKVSDNLTFLIPDFGLYSWPAHQVGTWPEVRQKTQELQENLSFNDKVPKLLWRGTLGFGSEIRQSLVDNAAGKPWSAVSALEWGASDFKEHMVTMPEHCEYKYLAHTEGLAYSGRLKYLHNCESVIIAHEPDYETHDQHLMIDSGPKQNFVRVKRDFSDLDEKMTWLIEHPDDAARIARNNVETFRDRYLTPAAEACYWRKLIHEWAEHGFEPEFYKMEGQRRVWRGVPFESFTLTRELSWDSQKVG